MWKQREFLMVPPRLSRSPGSTASHWTSAAPLFSKDSLSRRSEVPPLDGVDSLATKASKSTRSASILKHTQVDIDKCTHNTALQHTSKVGKQVQFLSCSTSQSDIPVLIITVLSRNVSPRALPLCIFRHTNLFASFTRNALWQIRNIGMFNLKRTRCMPVLLAFVGFGGWKSQGKNRWEAPPRCQPAARTSCVHDVIRSLNFHMISLLNWHNSQSQ